MAIKRICQGLIHDEILPGIEAKNVSGYRGIELPRLDLDDEVEFVTITTFAPLQHVIDFQGEKHRRGYVPETAQRVSRPRDRTAMPNETIETRDYR